MSDNSYCYENVFGNLLLTGTQIFLMKYRKIRQRYEKKPRNICLGEQMPGQGLELREGSRQEARRIRREDYQSGIYSMFVPRTLQTLPDRKRIFSYHIFRLNFWRMK